jgi:phosphatidylserine decarboxylase
MLNDYLKTIPQYLLPKKSLTNLAGCLANVKKSAIKNHLIKQFIQKYQVNMQEALEEDPENYACFNDFFIRRLKPECRSMASTDIICPVDGYVSEIGQITTGKIIQAKGRDYSVHELLACEKELSHQFNDGCFTTLYLSPQDYHRVHMPVAGTVQQMTHVPGKLFSVQPVTARVIPKLFARNERLVVFFATPLGLMAMVLVGATIVGGIGTSWHGDVRRRQNPTRFVYPQNNAQPTLEKSAEMGYFKLGSTVVLLFAEGNHLEWQPHLRAGDKVRFGEALGNIIS